MEKQKKNHAMGLPLGCPMNETAYILATSCPCPGGFEVIRAVRGSNEFKLWCR